MRILAGVVLLLAFAKSGVAQSPLLDRELEASTAFDVATLHAMPPARPVPAFASALAPTSGRNQKSLGETLMLIGGGAVVVGLVAGGGGGTLLIAAGVVCAAYGFYLFEQQ